MLKQSIKYKNFSFCWFPMEAMWMVFDLNHHPLSGFFESIEECEHFSDTYKEL